MGVKYTWTVSVIALLDREDEVNGKFAEKAYKEFEESIESTKASKNIKFIIYLYDLKSKMAFIKKASIKNKKYKIKNIAVKRVENFYEKDFIHLVTFFNKHVAKKKKQKKEIHKHLHIVWGHAAGLGFFKQTIKQNIRLAVQEQLKISGEKEFSSEQLDKQIEISASKIFSYNFLRSQLSLKPDKIPFEYFTSNLSDGNLSIKKALSDISFYKSLEKNFNIVTAAELNKIIAEGFKNDVSVCTTRDRKREIDILVPGKIQILLCLACYVNMIETGFALKENVNVYVAPQTQMSFYGYNYKRLFELITQNSRANEIEISMNITDNYLLKYLEPEIVKEKDSEFIIYQLDYKHAVAFCALYLRTYDVIVKQIRSFKTFIEELLANKTPVKNDGIYMIEHAFRDAYPKCLSTTVDGAIDTGIIDYKNFITQVFLLFDVTKLLDQIGDLGLILEWSFISDYFPGDLFQPNYRYRRPFDSQSPGSFSIFLPDKASSPIKDQLLALYFSRRTSQKFLEESEWDFIIKYIRTIT